MRNQNAIRFLFETVNCSVGACSFNKYTHKRIWQVGMIMKVRLEAILKHNKTLYKNAKNIKSRYNLANKYFKFLGRRTKKDDIVRKQMIFKI